MHAPYPAPEHDAKGSEDPRWLLVQRIASSQHLKTSARLRDFLLYVADCALRGTPEDATEQQIGMHVFRRPPGYNSSEDSIVRTHARLLRQKLAAYFAEEGLNEETAIEIPKGHYLPVFRPADAQKPPTLQPLPEIVRAGAQGRPPNFRLLIILATVIFLCIAAAALAWWSWPKPAAGPSSVDVFWRAFLTEDPPVVIFSNALFVGDSKSGLRYAPPQTSNDSTAKYVDSYTGIGEVASVYELTKLFDVHHSAFILKRSLLVTWDEAKSRNLIFIGSPAENPSLKVMPSTSDFTMMAAADFAGIVNHHPRPGEPALYSRPEHPLAKDYAILALLPGVQQGKRMLVFSGLTTLGTQAAVEFACRPESVAELLKAASFPPRSGQVRPFEAVLEVTIAGGVPLQTKIVAMRVH
ncbi:MAG: hypothetical protein ABI383_02635 [Acidobacteriaceae bacterium]